MILHLPLPLSLSLYFYLIPQHKPGSLIRLLNNSGIYRILSGHLPWGDSPSFVSHPLRPTPEAEDEAEGCKEDSGLSATPYDRL